MARATLTLREAEARADGTAPLYLVCRHKGARSASPTALTRAASPSAWRRRPPP
ncbi:MAG TPA: hypothetical protein VK002_07015 [Rubricoccaceae bacterium]|nr:hypothetical protein [Rubricoccaceae bacterium]